MRIPKVIRQGFLVLLPIFFFSTQSPAITWSEGLWLNSNPSTSFNLTIMAFVSPNDLNFGAILNIWKRLEKKYKPFDIQFLIVARAEKALPFSDTQVSNAVRDHGFLLPVLVDTDASVSKLWHAYVSPTINMVTNPGRVTTFEIGIIDPALIEKNIQKWLKENGHANLPPREFTNDGDAKTCGHGNTVFFGEKYQRAWSSVPYNSDEAWNRAPLWVEKSVATSGKLDITISRGAVGLMAQANHHSPIKVSVLLNGNKVPLEVRGPELLEDKQTGETFFLVKAPKLYSIISRSANLKAGNQKLSFVTTGQNLRFWALETLPPCQDFSSL